MYHDPKVFGYLVPIMEGAGAISQVGERIKSMGAAKVLLVHDKNLKELGLVDKVTMRLHESGIKWVSFDKVLPDPSDTLVEEGSALAHMEKIDGIIAIGGGSAIDTAKGIDLLMNNPAPLSQYYAVGLKLNPGVPFIAIPTTSGTGSEVTAMGTISTEGGRGLKKAVWPPLSKRIAIIDPEILTGMPYGLTVSTGIDAMAHAMEAMTSLLSTPTGDTLAMDAIRTIIKWLPVAANEPENLEARAKMAHAAAMAGIAFTNNGIHLGHSVAEIIGAKFHVPHGYACAATLPSTMEYAAKYRPAKVKMIAEAMGYEVPPFFDYEDIGSLVGNAIRSFKTQLNIKGLDKFGIKYEDLVNEEVAEMIRINPTSKICPNPPTIEEIMTVLSDSSAALSQGERKALSYT